jgi:hypothetical protein
MPPRKKQRSPIPDLVIPTSRAARVIFRLTDDDDDWLREFARKAGIGPSTLARLIIEKYIADHRGKKE